MKKSLKKSFKKGILGAVVPNKKIRFFPSGNKLKSKLIKFLPEPLKPSKFTPPKPVPKLRTKKEPPLPLPRSDLYPKPIAAEVKKRIDEIIPYYKPEAASEFNKILRAKKNLKNKITEKSRALKSAYEPSGPSGRSLSRFP